jgi:hypothetical protein
MTTLQPVHGESRPGIAIGGGILAGLATLALVVFGAWLANRSGDSADSSGRRGVGEPIEAAQLVPGDCIDFATGSSRSRAGLILADCSTPHPAQVTARVPHPEGTAEFPGDEAIAVWVGDQCDEPTEQFIGGAILATSLEGDRLLPDLADWEAGDTSATCYLANHDGSSLTASVEGQASQYARGAEVQVSRLMIGDCFKPTEGLDAYELNSNSPVTIMSCAEGHNGIFFGRSALTDGTDGGIPGAPFPGDEEIGQETSRRCGELFEQTFGKSSDGFNYRYWRPNQQSWDLGDRTILCAVLDDEELAEAFEPNDYQLFFNLGAGDCFNLGPEESAETLRLDDQVRVIGCEQSHTGQMVGSGHLESEPDAPFPAEDIKTLAGDECETLFLDFMGISPYESEFGKFPFWYPNDSGWEAGDRRYACAILESVARQDSLQGAQI